MATGDQADVYARLRRLLAPWFGDDDTRTPILNALLQAPAWALATIHELLAYARRQTRIATATDGWLELIALDFFGDGLPRLQGEQDAAYSLRIRREILRPRVTRSALEAMLRAIPGQEAVVRVYEPFNVRDCGAYGQPSTLAYGRAGRYGSLTAAYEVFVHLAPPQGYGIPIRGGWGDPVGAYGRTTGLFALAGESSLVGAALITDILAAVERVRAAGVTVFVFFDQTPGSQV